MRKKIESPEKKGQSMRMLVLYAVLVFGAIFIALLIKGFSIIQDSKFDGQHQFIVAIGNEKKAFGILAFEPQSTSLSFLKLPEESRLSLMSLNKTIGIIPDGYITMSKDIYLHGTIPALLQSFIFDTSTRYKNITLYDLFRFWFYANKIPTGSVYNETLSSFRDISAIDKSVILLFVDSSLANENVSVQIINATGESGLGGRLARVLTNLGGNVVSVQSSSSTESKSKIQYYDPETYTLKKLQSLLPYHREKLKKRDIAEIVITIGTDNKNTQLF